MTETKPKLRRGFGAMKPEKQQAIASMGGKKAHKLGTAHKFTSETAKLASYARKNINKEGGQHEKNSSENKGNESEKACEIRENKINEEV